ncbi:2-oxoacid:acceptor oxidoreductase family protein [Sporomusa acidovorans]|uniref:NADH-dependent phenylglyoxylate dehydrogenase subunit gamma n=1 Tax=Sporomusa acidovorans (strain ATCC 49682 / DSM 3132 / Mol) TaxID=1123286 RepID=A0ABZ3IZ84_SPOA4|nr:2-oxoacid:acceptor oxidoreductase family protein [Sporomusa acidovorans]OZC17260.1 NADH-dependent phenylglyoxylate dehydrogenase subunit gamma [Sporomusa acidovorans DSM 3132]SDF15980.1 2-oxoglutarate ferredoxin oxidoreductase subunit gamma [Sporomusa acidovorans]
MREFRLSGSGGQGLILAGIILAEAAIGDGKEAVQSQSYGPEARGGSSKSEVIISDSAIYYPKVENPDFLLAMTQEALDKYSGDLKADGVLVVDSTFVKEVPERFQKVHAVPITRLAKEQLGRDLFANIIALGIVAKITKAVSLAALEQAVLARVPKGTEQKNKQALELGIASIK